MYFYFIFYSVLFSSCLPLIFIFKKSIKIFEFYTSNKLLVLLLLSRFISDILFFVFGKVYGNSMPVFYFSILFEFIILVNILDGILSIKFKKITLFIGVLSFIADLSITHDLFSDNLYSTIVTFCIIIGITGKMIISNAISSQMELFVNSIFLYYIVALTYTFFQKFNFTTEIIYDFAFYFFALATLLFNISLTYHACTVKQK